MKKEFCKKASELQSLEEIGVRSGIRSLLANVPIEDMVMAARAGNLGEFLKNRVKPDYIMPCYLELQSSLLKAGYMRRDLYGYLEDFNWLAFKKAANERWYDDTIFDGASNVKRAIEGMTNRQYEEFDGLSVSEIKSLNNTLKSCLSCERSFQIIRIRFGLNGKEARPREDIADILGEDPEYIRDLEVEALKKFGEVVFQKPDETLS